MFLARKRIRLSKEEVRAELQPQLDAALATAAAAQAAAAEAQAVAAQATAQMEVMRERQALRDEEVRFLREQLARRENGSGNGGNGSSGAGNGNDD